MSRLSLRVLAWGAPFPSPLQKLEVKAAMLGFLDLSAFLGAMSHASSYTLSLVLDAGWREVRPGRGHGVGGDQTGLPLPA